MGRGSLVLVVHQGEAVLGRVRQGTPLVGPGREAHLDRLDREQKADLVGNHHRMGSRMQVEVGSPHPVARRVDCGSPHTLEGSLTLT